MSLLKRIMTQLTGAAHDAVDAAEDVGRTARQTVREIEDSIGEAEEALVSVQAEFNQLTHKRDAAQTQVELYGSYAEKAVAANNDALATEALTDQENAQKLFDTYAAQVNAFEPTLKTLKANIQQLRDRKDVMERDTSLIEARSTVAEAQSKAATVISGLGNGESSSKTFSRLEEKVQKQEAEAKARVDLAAEAVKPSAADKYASLDAGSTTSVAAKLAAMKANQGK